MSTNITKRQKRFLTFNLIWTAIIIGVMAANLAFQVYVFPNTVYVQEPGPIAEDPLEAWASPSYIVWEYNSTHYACRNMSTHMVDSLGTSDDNAIQWAINNCTTNGGTVYVKAPQSGGSYNAAVTLKDKVRLVLSNGASGITVSIDTGATATLEDFHNFDFKRWDSGTLVSFVEDRSQAESPSYTVFKSGSYYYAKNGTTGAIDSSSTNPGTLINWAFDNLPANGGEVFLSEGRYITTTVPINITQSYVTLRGTGRGSWIDNQCGVNVGGVLVTGTAGSGVLKGILIENLYITGVQSGTKNGDGIFVRYAERTTIRNNIIYQTGEEGIFVWNSTEILVDGNHLSTTGSHGIELVDDNQRCRVVNNYVEHAGYMELAHGIRLGDENTDNVIANNVIMNSSSYGINIFDRSDWRNIISGNHITLTSNAGMNIHATRCVITDNIVDVSGTYAYYFDETENCTISNNLKIGTAQIGFMFDNTTGPCLYNSVVGNVCGESSNCGLRLTDNSDYNIVVANNLYGDTLDAGAGANNVVEHNIST